MVLLDLLFGTWTGLLSLFTIVFMIGMFVFFMRLFIKKSKEEEE
ncbi:MAG: DUF3149 domain-containing protein [Gammaproteobacteria bacterium]|nr:DUF3149 domain-containing protein [Gammaproteobacteria bacterium]